MTLKELYLIEQEEQKTRKPQLLRIPDEKPKERETNTIKLLSKPGDKAKSVTNRKKQAADDFKATLPTKA